MGDKSYLQCGAYTNLLRSYKERGSVRNGETDGEIIAGRIVEL